MKGTCLANYICAAFADRLRGLTPADMPEQSEYRYEYYKSGKRKGEHKRDRHGRAIGSRVGQGRYFYGLCFVDPSYNPLSARLERCDGVFTNAADVGKTFSELQAAGKVVDLDVIRSWYRNTSKVPTDRHTVPSLDGACGMSSVEAVMRAIGLTLRYLPPGGRRRSSGPENYELIDAREAV